MVISIATGSAPAAIACVTGSNPGSSAVRTYVPAGESIRKRPSAPVVSVTRTPWGAASVTVTPASGRPDWSTMRPVRSTERTSAATAIGRSGHPLVRRFDAVRQKPVLDERNLPFVVDVEPAPLPDWMNTPPHPALRQQAGLEPLEALRPHHR